jgi:hypothetical protein
MNNQDKAFWMEQGARQEERFLAVAQQMGLSRLHFNPGKCADPTEIDFLWRNYFADLKTQVTPFFYADRYGFNPRFTVTFNHKDYQHYANRYGGPVHIFFWVDWTILEFRGRQIDYLYGIYVMPLAGIIQQIESERAPLHEYHQRKDDQLGNAKSSYLLDVRDMKTIAQWPIAPVDQFRPI